MASKSAVFTAREKRVLLSHISTLEKEVRGLGRRLDALEELSVDRGDQDL